VPMLTLLSWICQGLGLVQARTKRTILPSRPVRVVGRTWVTKALLRRELSRPDDITVVVAIRNRSDYRLVNLLRSIRGQSYPDELIRIVVVDYGSEPASARPGKSICEAHRAQYVRVDTDEVWSSARSLNVGIRRVDTKFLLIADVDVVFSPRYLADAVALLRASPPSVVCSAMLDLPEEATATLERAARTGEDLDFEALRQLCRPRLGWECHPRVCMTYTVLYEAIGGLDERYWSWGWDDVDLMKRFLYLGLRQRTQVSRSFYMHQWHPDSERGREAEHIQRNKSYCQQTHSILRNDHQWGVRSRVRPQ
jgi:GT2 family glycosyltransferase